ncbi:MAG: amidohydrolase [Proteocatella sp.]|nr:amidohydrolase [Proteocatella sp.]MBP9658314.1 amidohydrolase [Proteocatella sp.]
MIIRNGLIFLIENDGFTKKDIELKDGKIERIGRNLSNDSGSEEFDAEGMYITPGLIDAHSHIGLFNESMRWEGEDGNEEFDPVTPDMNAVDGINPFDISFREALEGGVTTASTGPGSANVIGGSFATISLYGNIVDNMVIQSPASMKCAFGENPKGVYGQKGKAPVTRMGVAAILRETIVKAENYIARKEDAQYKGEHFDIDPKMEAMIPVIEKDIPLKAHAHRADDICTAIRIAKEFNVKLTLEHCTEGHLIADYIAEEGLSAQVGPTFGSRTKVELTNKSFETAKILSERGVKVSIITDHPVIPQQSLNMCAAMAVKAGMDEFEALKAITLNPAQTLGIDHLKGQLKEGLDADIVIWDLHPLDLQASTVRVYVKGEEVFGR